MVELRTVKQLREFLENFSDGCEVKVNVDGLPMGIAEYGWSGNDGDSDLAVEQSMKQATELYLHVEPNHESE